MTEPRVSEPKERGAVWTEEPRAKRKGAEGRRRLKALRRRAIGLEGFTWLYLIWSLVPIGLAVLFSFNHGKSQAVWQGFSWQWYFTDPVNSVLHDPALSTAVLVTLKLSFYTTL